VGEILVRWYGPGFASVQHSDDRLEQTRRNLHTAFALGAYQREHGNYPKTLAELAPKYLANIPQDLFTGKSLVYQPSANGYLLYSFGINGRDDQGRGYDDDPPGDDLSVRMPLPALPPSRARVIAKNAMARQQWSHVTIGERRVEKSSECHPCIHRH